MADVGLEFSSDSFKVFNQTLKEFDRIAKKVDTKLTTLSGSISTLLNTTNATNLRNFDSFQNSFSHFVSISRQLSATTFNKIQIAISQLLKATSSYGVLQFEQFRTAFNKFAQDLNLVSYGDITAAANSIKNFFKALEGFKPSGATKVIFELQYFFNELNKIIKSLGKSGGGRIDVFNKTVISIRTIVKSFADMGKFTFNKAKIVEVLDFLKRFIFGKLNFGGIVGQIKRLGKIDEKSVDAFSKIGQAIANLIRGLNEISEVKFNKEAVIQGLDFLRRFLFGGKFASMFGRGGITAIIKRMGNIRSEQVKNFSRSMNALSSMIKAIKDLDKLVLGDNSVKNIRKNLDAITKIFGQFKGGVVFGKGIGGGGSAGSPAGGMTSFFGSLIKSIGGFNLEFEREIRFLRNTFHEYIDINKTFVKEIFKMIPFSNTAFRLLKGAFNVGLSKLRSVITAGFNFLKGGGLSRLANVFRFPGLSRDAKRNTDQAFREVETGFKRSVSASKSRLQGIIDGGFKLAFGSISLQLTQALARSLNPANLIGAFVEFESAFTGVVKTLDTSGMGETEAAQFIADLANDVRTMATEEGGVLSGLDNAAVSIAGIMESAGSLGIARENLKEFTETVGAMTLATNLSADSASDFFGQFGAITQSTDYDRIGATMVGLGNSFAATESQIADFALRLAGAGSSAGLTEAQILGIGAAMASVGINAEAGGTAMTTILNEITVATVEGGDKLNKFAELAGVSAEEFAASWEEDAAGTLEKFISGLGELENAEQITVLDELGLDGIRTADVLRRLGGAEGALAKALGIANTEWDLNTALMSEAEKRAATMRSSINRMKNNFFDLKVTVGEIFAPIFAKFIDGITKGVMIINDFLKANKEFISETLDKMFTTLAKVTPIILTFVGTFVLWAKVLPALGSSLGGIFKALKLTSAILASPIGIVAMLLSLVAVPLIMKKIEDGTINVQEVFLKFQDVLHNVGTFFTNAFTVIKDTLLPGVGQAISDVVNGIKLIFSSDSEAGINKLKGALSGLKTSIQDTFNSFTGRDQEKQLGERELARLGEGTKVNPIIKSVEDMFEAARNHDWKTLAGLLRDAITDAISGAFRLIGFGEGGRFGFANNNIAELTRMSLENAAKPENFAGAVDRMISSIRLSLYDVAKGDYSSVIGFIERNISQIVRTALAGIITLVFGFPIGTLFSLGNLLVSAIEKDFLGIRSILEESAIGRAIISLADGIVKLIQDAFATVFGGGTEKNPVAAAVSDGLFLLETPTIPQEKQGIFANFFEKIFDIGIDEKELNTFLDTLKRYYDQIKAYIDDINWPLLGEYLRVIPDAISNFATGAVNTALFVLNNFVVPALENFASSLRLFFRELDIEDIKGFAVAFGLLKAIFLAPAILHMVGVFALLGGVAKSIGDFGAAIADLFGAIGVLLDGGDPGAALQKVGDAIAHIWNGIKNFIEGAVQPFINLLNKIFEMESIQNLIPDDSIFAPLKNGLISVGEAFDLLELVAMGVLLQIQRTLEDIGYRIEYQINDLKIRGLQALKDANLATGDQLLQLDEATAARNALNAVSVIQDAIFSAAARDTGLDLSTLITFEEWDGTDFTGTLEQALNNPEVVNKLSGSTRTMLLRAAENALEGGDGKAIADALNVFKALGETPPELPAGTQQIIATSLDEYKKLIEAGYDNIVLELPDMYQLMAQASFDQGVGDGTARFQIPEGMAVQFAQQFNAGLTAVFEANPLDLAAIFSTNAMLNQNSEILAKAGVDMAAALRESVANAFTTGVEATGDTAWAAGSVLDEFLPLLNLSGSQEEIQAQFNEQLGLLTQNLNAEDALAIGQALEIKLEEIILAGTGATIDLQVDKEAIDAAGAEAMKQNGLDVIGGLLAGVGEMLGLGDLQTEAEKVFTSFNDAFQTAAGIASPSQVFIDNGKSLVDGLNQGITEQMPIYQETMTMMAGEITKFKDHTNLEVEQFKQILTGIPFAILDTGLQFTNAVMIWAVQGLVFGLILDTIALKIAGVADQLSNLAAFLGLVGGSLGNLNIPGGSGGEDDGLAKGGSVSRGKIYEVLENNLPFEMFKTKGKTYFISNSDGMMLSPLTANAIGAGNVSNSTTNNTSGDVVMNFNINSNNPEEIVRVAKREFENMRQQEGKREKRVRKRTGVYGE